MGTTRNASRAVDPGPGSAGRDRDRCAAVADGDAADLSELAAAVDTAIDDAVDAASIADWPGIDAARERARAAIATWAGERGL